VLRLASEEDYRQKQENEQFERDAKGFCHERIMARGLPMKLVCAEAALDKKRIVFYFTADGRIDFRELVKDLAAKFKTRIEMRQIGVRDKAKLVGGYSICGKELCCRLFLTTFEPISIKMAKQQDLSLNTGKLSGACGRLMCCLGYEYHEDSAPTPVEVPSGTVQAGEVQSAALAEGPEPEGEDTAPPEEQAGDKTSGTASGAEPQVQDHHRKRRRRRRHRKRLHKHE
jgi:hypothetical protein